MAIATTPTTRLTPERLILGMQQASQSSLSPDGTRVVYVVTSVSSATEQSSSQVWISDIDGTNQRQLTQRPNSHGSPVWSPDGTSIAFVGPAHEDGHWSIFVLPLAGGEAREVIRHQKAPAQLAWSPDESAIAYVLEVDPNRADTTAGAAGVAPIRVVKRPDYKQDGRGFVNDVRAQLFVTDVESGEHRQMTTVANDHATPRWSSDGKTIGVSRLNYHGLYLQLVLVDVQTGLETVVGQPTESIRNWRWTPDGTSILLLRSPHYAFGAHLTVLDIASGTEQRIAADVTWHPAAPLDWIDDQHVLIGGFEHGLSGLWIVDIAGGDDHAVERVATFPALVMGVSYLPGGREVVLHWDAPSHPGELMAFDLDTKSLSPITHLNDTFFAESPAAKTERRSVAHEGLTIDYWLTYPADFDPTQRYPVVLDIHGGPHGFHGEFFNAGAQLLANAGYLVISPNPRGSATYGDAFTEAVLGDWGGGDWRDDLAALNDSLQLPYADSSRTGVYGYSYGGYMSAWAIGQTDRFQAAVIGAPITDLIANYGTADIGHYGGEFQWGGRVQDIWGQLIEQSPITHARHATTPSLLLHPEEDQRCPISGSEQLFISLLANGVDTELVRYPGQSHLMPWSGPIPYRIDYFSRVIAWFDGYLA